MSDTDIKLRDYFDFLSEDDIRIKGTRVGIEIILEDYLNAISPEEIAIRYATVTLEQVYATITYYLRNQHKIDQYLARWRQYAESAWQQQVKHPTPAVQHLQALKQRRLKSANSHASLNLIYE
jgi:uncharacterized protein (DUF433 family)